MNDDKLKNVSGGQECPEPEEFDWQTKGYVTPVKEPSNKKDDWIFGPIKNSIDEFLKNRFKKD